jgi:hypothetical protein
LGLHVLWSIGLTRNRISAAYSLIEWYVYHEWIKPSLLKEFNEIGKRATKTQGKRDIVAHGLWWRDKGKWWLLKKRGLRSPGTKT